MTSKENRSVLRWGGIAGFGGGVLFIVVFAIVIIFAGPEPAGPAGAISRFPEIRVARTFENGLYLAVLMLWVLLALALHQALRAARPAAALFGSALNIFGLVILAAGAIPHLVTLGLSEQYHASGVTAGEQQILVLQWHAALDMFEALLVTGLLIMPVGVILLGSAMFRDPSFGKAAGGTSVVLGVIGLGAAIVVLIDPDSVAAVLGVFALIGFHLLAGWKAYRGSANVPVASVAR